MTAVREVAEVPIPMGGGPIRIMLRAVLFGPGLHVPAGKRLVIDPETLGVRSVSGGVIVGIARRVSDPNTGRSREAPGRRVRVQPREGIPCRGCTRALETQRVARPNRT